MGILGYHLLHGCCRRSPNKTNHYMSIQAREKKLRRPEDMKTFKATIKALKERVELFTRTKTSKKKNILKIIQKSS